MTTPRSTPCHDCPAQGWRGWRNCAPGETHTTKGTRPQTEKNPNLLRLGSSTTPTPLAPFPSKGSPVESQAGLLARGTHLLSAPSQGIIPQWSSQISFRSQLRGSNGFAPSSLLTVSSCEATWLFSTMQLFSQNDRLFNVLSRRTLLQQAAASNHGVYERRFCIHV